MLDNELQIVIYILIFISTVLIVDRLMRYVLGKKSYKTTKNRRLKILDKSGFSEEALFEMHRRRGLSSEGKYILPIISFNRLLLQSGTSIGVNKLIFLMVCICLASFIAVYFFDRGFIIPSLVSVIIGIVLPILWLRRLRNKRRNKIEGQLPEALDVMRRSQLRNYIHLI